MINRILLSFVMFSLLLVGCGGKSETPESVAADFWQAVIDKDMETAKTSVTRMTRHDLIARCKDNS